MKTVSLSCLVAAIAVLSACGNNSGKIKDAHPVGVKTFVVDSSSVSAIPTEYAGVADDSYSTMLSFPVSGNIRKIYVNEGDRVSAGDLVACLDSRTAENALSAARASYERAVDGYERAKSVYEKGSMPEIKWIEVTSQRDQAAALYDIAMKNLEDCSLFSPADGVVSSVIAEQGMNIAAFSPVIGLIDPRAAEVEIKVPESEITSISIGGPASVEIQALGKSGIHARVVSKGVTADPLSHSYKVRLSISDPQGVMPGMTCRVVFSGLGFSSSSFVIPGKSVSVSNDGRRYVWLVEDGRAVRRYVGIGGMTASGVMVVNGLEIGDAVVVEGMTKISEGMEVVVE